MLFKEQSDRRGVRGDPVLRPIIATVPGDGMAALPGGTWTVVQGRGGGLWPWCNSLPASIPGATHQIPGLQGGNIQWKMNLASIGRVSSWFAGRSSRAPWGPACQHCPGLWHCHLPRLPAITPLPELPLAMAASAEAGWQQGGHIAGTVGTHGGGRAESVHGGKREAGEKKQSE